MNENNQAIVFLEGYISVRETLQADSRRIYKIYIHPRVLRKRDVYRELNRLVQLHDVPVEILDEQSFDEKTQSSTCGGIFAHASERTLLRPEDLVKRYGGGTLAILEGFEDPYNFGYAVRALYAAGFSGILTSRAHWNGNDGVYIKASAGATEHMPMAYIEDYLDTIDALKHGGYAIACAMQSKKSVSLYDVNLSSPHVLVFGGERRGISKPLIEHADAFFEIPYGRVFDYALPGASAVAVVAFEAMRRNETSRRA